MNTSCGVFYHTHGQYELAIIDYTIAVRLDPAGGDAHNDIAAYGNRGAAYDMLKEYDRAITDYTKVLEIDPSDKAFHMSRGNDYNAQGQTDQAIADLKIAAGGNSSYADGLVSLGAAYYTPGQL